jgi:hypothetical protein
MTIENVESIAKCLPLTVYQASWLFFFFASLSFQVLIKLQAL